MALSFLRHLKPEALKSRKKCPASQTAPQSDTAQERLKDDARSDDSISVQYMPGIDDHQRAEEEESGICTDTSSEISRRESNESSQEVNSEEEEVASMATIEDLEDDETTPGDRHTLVISDEGQLDETASDSGAHDAPESSEEERQTDIRSSYIDADTESSAEHHHPESVGHHLRSMEHPLDSSEHHSEEPPQHPEVSRPDNFHGSSVTSFPHESEEEVSERETSSPTIPPPANQHDVDDTADETESYLSNRSGEDSVEEPGAISTSQSSTLSYSEDTTTPSRHSQDSSEISTNMITEFTPPPPPPPPPPLPPGLGLLLPGDHTTSSTTDFQPTSASVSTKDATINAAGSRNQRAGDDLMRQIREAAQNISNQREVSRLDHTLSSAKPTQFPASFSSDLKSVIASRQSRIGTMEMEVDEIPGKINFYKSRIGIPPEDTELCRVFLKRAAKTTPLENNNAPSFGSADEKTAAGQEVIRRDTSSDNRKASADDIKQFTVANTDDTNFEETVADEITEESAAEDISSCTTGAYEGTEKDTQQIESDTFLSTTEQNSDSEQNEFSMQPCSIHADPSTETEEKEFDRVVEDFDQFLEENVSANSWQDPSETSLPLEGQSGTFPVLDQKASHEPLYTNNMSENSSNFSPDFSSFSEAESPVFEEMDEAAISKSAQTVQERSKLLAQPLESYNILPTIKEMPPKIEPKSRFSFRNVMASLRNTLGRKSKQNPTEDNTRFQVGDGTQMKFDDNWSIYDTLTQRGPTPEDSNKNKSRSLRNVFDNYEVKSFSEFTNPDQNSGKDFSVRNWQEVMERSNSDAPNNSAETLDQGNPETAAITGFLMKRASSSPNLGSLSDTKYSSQMEKPQLSTKNRAFKKKTSSKADMEERTSNTSAESPSRLGSSGLNSTLPSRHLHGMIQSFDSIYPGHPSLDRRHYQKKAEPRKFSLPSKGTAGLLSPVQRRKQRAQQAKR